MKGKKILKWIVLTILSIILILVIVVFIIYFTRIQSIMSIEKLTEYSDGYNIYKIDIKYDYDLDSIIAKNIKSDQELSDAVLSKAIPLIPVHMESPDYSCSAFSIIDNDGNVLMGRNYDFDVDTSAMIVYCSPKDGYRSVGTAALDHLGASAMGGIADKLASLATPYICLDGMNEKGVSISILMLDSEPVIQDTEKPDVFTTLAIRLVLDRAATTAEAVELLRNHDMFAVSGGDYHFFITDVSGDSRIVEYDCHSATRDLVDTPVRTATNFYEIYKDKVLPDQYNGIYGHGKERYDRLEKLFDENEGNYTKELAWKALEAAQQLPKPEELTSNTQWSIVYNDTKLTAEYVLRRKWGEIVSYDMKK